MNDQRLPPHSVEAEKSVLGACMFRPETVNELGEIAVDDFFLPAHREIWEALLHLQGKGKPVDVLTVADELQARGMLARIEGGQGYLLALIDVGSIANVAYHARMVRERAQLRRLIAAAAELQVKAYGEVDDVQELLAEARDRMAAVELGLGGGGPKPIGYGLPRTLESLGQRVDRPSEVFVPTGIGRFDEAIGGFRGGQLVVIATRPGMGKSAFALDVLLRASKSLIPSLLFSYEMSRDEINERALAKVGNVNGRSVITGRLTVEERSRIQRAAKALDPLPLYLDTRELSARRLCATARKWHAEMRRALGEGFKRAIIAVDYLGLIPSIGDARQARDERHTRAQELGVLTRSLKLLASELDTPILLLCQLNREATKADREPMISDLRDSGAIEQDANMVVFPWWEGTPLAGKRHRACLIVGKNRGGPMGKVEVDWIPETMTFVDNEMWNHEPEQRSFA